MTFLRSQHIVQRGERAVVWFGIKSARKRLEVPEKTVVNGQVRERENNDFQRSRGRRGNISLQIFRRAADPLWRQARTNIKSQRRAHIAGSFTIIQVGPSDLISLDAILALPPVIHPRRPSHSFSPLSLPSSSLIRTSAGCVSYAVGG